MRTVGRVASLLVQILLGMFAVGFVLGVLTGLGVGESDEGNRSPWVYIVLFVGTFVFAIGPVRRFRSGEPMWGEDD